MQIRFKRREVAQLKTLVKTESRGGLMKDANLTEAPDLRNAGNCAKAS